MGRQALRCHAKGIKHKNVVKATQSKNLQTLDFWFRRQQPTSNSNQVSATQIRDDKAVPIKVPTPTGDQGTTDMVVPLPPPPAATETEPMACASISGFFTGDSVLTAEILWAVKTVSNHYSCNSSSGIDSLFWAMFPDSHIAGKFQCGPTKCMYLICHGLAPFFMNSLMTKIKKHTLRDKLWWKLKWGHTGGVDGSPNQILWSRNTTGGYTFLWSTVSWPYKGCQSTRPLPEGFVRHPGRKPYPDINRWAQCKFEVLERNVGAQENNSSTSTCRPW